MNKMSTKSSSSRGRKSESKRKESEPLCDNYVNENGSDDEDVIDLCDDHDYQVLSAVFETDKGRNIAEILSRLQKDVHLLAMSVHQLIQLSLASQSVRRDGDSEEEEVSESDGDENEGSAGAEADE
jgi:hypothetical protein